MAGRRELTDAGARPPRESPWTAKVGGEMKRLGALVFAVVGGDMQEPGWPDRYVAHPSYVGWLEFKGATTRVEKLQEIVMRRLKARGANCYVVRWPGRIETETGELLREFDGTGGDLLVKLRELILTSGPT